METMSLVGGIETYSHNKRHKLETSPNGRKVYFLNQNGRDYDLKEAQKYFFKNHILTVKEIYVGGFSSEVVFEEVPSVRFNTVMFADLKEEGDEIVKVEKWQ